MRCSRKKSGIPEYRKWGSIIGEGVTGEIYLVRAPITFAHSQLVLRFPPGGEHKEAKKFFEASKYVEIAISCFSKLFSNDKVIYKFRKLADLTLTEKRYKKTLVLRVSANEKPDEYRVHLLPYFESHEERCKKRFQSIHNVSPCKNGGLIGWLGERETITDIWQEEKDRPFSHKEDMENILEHNFKMGNLSKLLKREWEKISNASKTRAGQI